MSASQSPQPARGHRVLPVIRLVVLAALTGPLLIAGVLMALFALMPGGFD